MLGTSACTGTRVYWVMYEDGSQCPGERHAMKFDNVKSKSRNINSQIIKTGQIRALSTEGMKMIAKSELPKKVQQKNQCLNHNKER